MRIDLIILFGVAPKAILGRGWWNRRLENLGIAKIGLTPPPLTPILALWWI